ncbi:hypothetical protein A11A3_04590 [Alcanivorax hongdengensis A-11-3]|uniref:Lipoprotein SmpA/OmlA domain-containing protein n=1 Tax=Alcanivorax hongdengensis A-11-3 TaxID=1177179 RepID=L0WEG1_9GAMM|nr:hypothetical protein [Alcanivorax hongdengensis]EKF75228.1 hypothetical protein A11A3_04590 [Alcanivorax hongdengensis A-11-3]
MTIKITTLLATAVLAMPVSVLAADDVPQRGMTQSQVRAQFGAPEQTRPPVGNPPITRWRYDHFTVYFERNLTLYTVVDQPAQPAPAATQPPSQTPPALVPKAAPAPQPAAESNAADSEDMTFDPISGRFVPAGGTGADSETSSAAADKTASSATDHTDSVQAAEPTPATPPAQKAAPKAAAEAQPPAAKTPPPAKPKAPPPAPAPQQSSAPAGNKDAEFRFDPVTGRIVISGQENQAAASRNAPEAADAKVDASKKAATNAEPKPPTEKPAATKSPEPAETPAEPAASPDEEHSEAPGSNDSNGGGYHIDWGARQ